MRKMEEKHDGKRKRNFDGGREAARLIRFPEDEGRLGAGEQVGANAARVHVEDIRGIVLSTLSTPVPLPLLVSSSAGGARVEANQEIMEELHTCAGSPMLYYINHGVGSTLPVYIIRRAREGRKLMYEERTNGTCEQTHVRASIAECSKESLCVPLRRHSRERGRDKYLLPRRCSVSKWLERKHVSLCEKEPARAASDFNRESIYRSDGFLEFFLQYSIMRRKRRHLSS